MEKNNKDNKIRKTPPKTQPRPQNLLDKLLNSVRCNTKSLHAQFWQGTVTKMIARHLTLKEENLRNGLIENLRLVNPKTGSQNVPKRVTEPSRDQGYYLRE